MYKSMKYKMTHRDEILRASRETAELPRTNEPTPRSI